MQPVWEKTPMKTRTRGRRRNRQCKSLKAQQNRLRRLNSCSLFEVQCNGGSTVRSDRGFAGKKVPKITAEAKARRRRVERSVHTPLHTYNEPAYVPPPLPPPRYSGYARSSNVTEYGYGALRRTTWG